VKTFYIMVGCTSCVTSKLFFPFHYTPQDMIVPVSSQWDGFSGCRPS